MQMGSIDTWLRSSGRPPVSCGSDVADIRLFDPGVVITDRPVSLLDASGNHVATLKAALDDHRP